MRVYFLSDIHLPNGDSPPAHRFIAFLREHLRSGDTLILGGDVFDLFIGNKSFFRQKFAAVLGEIGSAAGRGVKIYFLEGNHDFQLAGVFGSVIGIEIKSDTFSLQVGERRIDVSHGDLIDPEDKGYRFLRAVMRSAFFRALVRLVPGSWIDAIGTRSSSESRKYTEAARQGHQARIRALYLEFARQRVGQGADHVLVGHSHLPDQIALEAGERVGEYINLGYSGDSLAFALLEDGATTFKIAQYGQPSNP